MFDGGLRPPINLYPIVPPTLVSGAEVDGNSEESNQVTEEGKTFLLTVANLLHSSIKVFGNTEEIPWYDAIWPGIETEGTTENKSQFIKFIGKSEEEAVDWGSCSRVDYDLDGVTDLGRSIEDALPYDLYKLLNQGNSIVSIDSLWKEMVDNGELSGTNSFGEVIMFNRAEQPTTDEGRFALLSGLLQTKRNWAYGLSALGLNAYNLNEAGALDNFINKFNSPLSQGVGGINIQALLNYICLAIWGEQSGENEPEVLKGVNVRFNELANDAWINDQAITDAKAYYASRALNVNVNQDEGRINAFRAALRNFRDLINADGSINFPARNRGESDAAYAARQAGVADRLTGLLNTMKNALNSLESDHKSIDSDFGLVSAALKESEAAFAGFIGNFNPSAIQVGSNLSAVRTLLGQIDAAITNIDSAQQDIKANPDAVVQMLFDEFKTPLSQEKMSVELSIGITTSYNSATDKTLNYVSGVMGINTAFSAINKGNRRRFEQQKDEKRSNEIMAMKSDAKHRSAMKSEEKRMQNKMSGHSQENRRAESKQSASKSSKAQPKKSQPAGRQGR